MAQHNKLTDILHFVLDLIHKYQETKGQQLFAKIKSSLAASPAPVKRCPNPLADPFRASTSTLAVDHEWPADRAGYQAYCAVNSNVHFQHPMDWMEIARPHTFSSAPEPMQFKNQDRYYPRDFDDEKHTKLRLLLNFGYPRFGADPAYLYTLAALLDLPDKLVLNYFYKTLRELRDTDSIQSSSLPPAVLAARHAQIVQVLGPEATRTLTADDVAQMEASGIGNRAFLLTQYFCLHCLRFFCPDHLSPDYQPLFYFHFDETEYSESRSDMFHQLKKSPLDLDRLYKSDPPPTALQTHVECAASQREQCWKYRKEQATQQHSSSPHLVLDVDAIVRKIALPADRLDRLKNLLRVCLNSGTNNPCFLEHISGERLSCVEIGALASKLFRDEFRQASAGEKPGGGGGAGGMSTSQRNRNKKAFLDRRRGVVSGLTMDRSQYTGMFDDFQFPLHAMNLLQQKNRIIIGDSDICPGLGLFAGQNFGKDQLVCLYFGEVLEEEETSNFRAKVNNLYGTSYVFSLSEGKQFSIDSLVYGNKSRFVNHNEGTFNNCIIELAEVNNMEYVVFKAKREIRLGEELFFDYGDSYTLNWKYVYKQMVHFLSKLAERKRCNARAKSKITKINL
jgi:hypothetical protein